MTESNYGKILRKEAIVRSNSILDLLKWRWSTQQTTACKGLKVCCLTFDSKFLNKRIIFQTMDLVFLWLFSQSLPMLSNDFFDFFVLSRWHCLLPFFLPFLALFSFLVGFFSRCRVDEDYTHVFGPGVKFVYYVRLYFSPLH